MENYRQIKSKQIERKECFCCNSKFEILQVHHINKNKKDNRVENLLVVCSKCHVKIHQGLTKKDFLINEETKEKILFYRELLLTSQGISKKKIKEMFETEKWLASGCYRFQNKSVCSVCKTRKNLFFYVPKLLRDREKEELRTLGIPFCKKCYKDVCDISDNVKS